MEQIHQPGLAPTDTAPEIDTTHGSRSLPEPPTPATGRLLCQPVADALQGEQCLMLVVVRRESFGCDPGLIV
jgi:hypothetical protein